MANEKQNIFKFTGSKSVHAEQWFDADWTSINVAE